MIGCLKIHCLTGCCWPKLTQLSQESKDSLFLGALLRSILCGLLDSLGVLLLRCFENDLLGYLGVLSRRFFGDILGSLGALCRRFFFVAVLIPLVSFMAAGRLMAFAAPLVSFLPPWFVSFFLGFFMGLASEEFMFLRKVAMNMY